MRSIFLSLIQFTKEYVKAVGLPVLIPLALHLTDPFGLATYFGYLFVASFLFFQRDNILELLDKDGFWIFLFSLAYTLFDALGPNKGPQYLVIQAIFPIIFYLAGKKLVSPGITKMQVVYLLIIIGLLFSLTGLLSVGFELITKGFVAEERSIANFWTGSSMTATGVAAYIIYPLVLPGILLVSRKKTSGIILSILAVIYVITLLCSFRLGSRTCLAITGISILIGLVQVLLSQSVLQNLKFLFFTTLCIILFLRFFPIDLEAEYLSTLGERINDKNVSSISTAGNRTGLWQEAVDNMIKHPLGWDTGHLAHNTWLDIARVAGVVPLILFLINNVICLHNVKSIFSLKVDNLQLTTVFSLYILATFLFLFGEPMILGNFYFITFFFLLQGILKQSLILFVRK